jgi:predicted nucleotidyltransferase
MNQQQTESYIRGVIERHLDPKETLVFLFGSRVDQNARATSDYDVGLLSETRIPLSIIGRIKGELEDSSIPVHIDVIDFSSVSNEFRDRVFKNIRIWNKPEKIKLP